MNAGIVTLRDNDTYLRHLTELSLEKRQNARLTTWLLCVWMDCIYQLVRPLGHIRIQITDLLPQAATLMPKV